MATWCFRSAGVCWEVSKAFPECCCAGCRELLFLPYSMCSFRAGSKSLSRRAAKIKKSVFPKPLVRRLALPQESKSANGATYKSQGQARSEAERVAPGKYTNERFRPERPKYARYYAPSGQDLNFDSLPGATRFALAPGFYISRRWRCVGAKADSIRDPRLSGIVPHLDNQKLVASPHTHYLRREASEVLDLQAPLLSLLVHPHSHLGQPNKCPGSPALLIENDLDDRVWVIRRTIAAADLMETLPALEESYDSAVTFNLAFANDQQIAARLSGCRDVAEIVIAYGFQQVVLAFTCQNLAVPLGLFVTGTRLDSQREAGACRPPTHVYERARVDFLACTRFVLSLR